MKINQSPIRFGFFALVLAGILTACPSTNSGGGGSGGSTLSGKITNWPTTKTGSLRFVVNGDPAPITAAQTPINANGDFSSLAFPDAATVTPVLTPATNAYFGCSSNALTITPMAVKLAPAQLLVQNSAGAEAGRAYQANRDFASGGLNAVGDKQVFRIYSDTNATVSGTCPATNGSFTLNINLTTGWNVVVAEVKSIQSGANSATYTSGAVPSDVKFYYSGDSKLLSKRNQFFSQ